MATQADISDRYEKVEENVFRMKPIGRRPSAKVLTPLGKTVVIGFLCCISLIIMVWYLH